MPDILNYIDGVLVPPVSGHYLDNHAPATGQVYGRIPDSDSEAVERAVQAAKAAFPAWSDLDLNTRAQILVRIADLIEDRAEMLAQAESRDNGKPVELARTVDIPRGSANFRYFARAITQIQGESYDMDSQGLSYT